MSVFIVKQKRIKKLKQDIYKHIKEFMFKELFNHRKAKEGLVSAHNQLLEDANRMLSEWSESDLSYLDLSIKGKSFKEVKKGYYDITPKTKTKEKAFRKSEKRKKILKQDLQQGLV